MPFQRHSDAKAVVGRRVVVYQLRATVNTSAGIETAYYCIIDVIQAFIAKSLYVRTPDEAQAYRNFTAIKKERGICECISAPERKIWAARFDFQDKDKQRWFYDVAMTEENGELLFGIKIETVSILDPMTIRQKLTLVGELIPMLTLRQGCPLKNNLWYIDNPRELTVFRDFLLSPRRSLPVIVITAVNRQSWQFTPHPPPYLVDASYLAVRLQGYACVVRLGFNATFEWSRMVSREWSVFNGACRVYYPSMDFGKDIPGRHPVHYKDKIWYWSFDDKHGPHAYTSFLIDLANRASGVCRINWQGLYFVPDARVIQAELQMAHTLHVANAPEREKALGDHVQALQLKLTASREESEHWLDELDSANETVEFYRQENMALRAQLESLRAHIAKLSDAPPDAAVPIPDGYAAMKNWVKQYLAGRLLLHPRAERALAKAEYLDVERVYRALLILANEFRNSRLGVSDEKPFRAALQANALEFSGAIDRSRAGAEGDAYFVNYPPGGPNRRLLKFHLEHGNSRERRYCLRIYFFWDEETSQVIVGYLPGHLSNRMS